MSSSGKQRVLPVRAISLIAALFLAPVFTGCTTISQFIAQRASLRDIDAGKPSTLILGDAGDGDVWVSVKIEITNRSKYRRRVDIDIQGIDRDGFEREDFSLSWEFAPGETRILTDKTFVSRKDYDSIVEWRIDEIEVEKGG